MGDAGLEESVSTHFGRAPTFTVYEPTTGNLEVVENGSDHMGGEQLPPDFVADLDVDVVLCQDVGGRSIRRLEARGVDVFSDAAGTVRDAVTQWDDGDLPRADPADEHDHADHERADHD
jgi:predicted Fe-Mo cluster-binding NifX family protein